ncbi:PH domain-containing protein [Microlunatus flavus]|uniref:PH domain-containing protein n=1 Tax=Microlunatus flavus TaxID=1036181 RepID=UPI001E327ED3|nr:PH domain-containing protein [Microlunatus flavus]
MADQGASDPSTRTWRVTGWRRWLYVLLLVSFLAQAVNRLVDLLVGPPPHYGDGIFFALALLAALAYGWMVVLYLRTRVTLTPEGVEVRSFRTKVIPYTEVERAYRNRFSRGVVSLDLLDATRIALPAPVSGFKDAAPELDEAVALIQARVDGARAAAGEDVAG